MGEDQTEFRKRKKSEKRLQAERQVIDAYSKCKKGFFENDIGEKEPHCWVILDDKSIEWRIQMEPEIEDLYSTIDVSKALDMPRERLRDWVVRGFIEPSLPSTSKGTIAIFTRDDVVCVALFQNLVDMSLKREAASEYIKLLVRAKLIGAVDFIILLFTIKDGKPLVDIQLCIGDKCDLYIDSHGNIKVGSLITFNTEEWDGIHVLNMANLQRKVNLALAKLV